MKERFTEEQVIGFPARSRIRTVRQRAVPSAAVRQVSGTLPPESEQRSNVRNGRGAGRQLTGLNGRYLMSYPPFKHIDFWKPLQPLVAVCRLIERSSLAAVGRGCFLPGNCCERTR
jgi:hypothetical protein